MRIGTDDLRETLHHPELRVHPPVQEVDAPVTQPFAPHKPADTLAKHQIRMRKFVQETAFSG